MMNDMPDMPDMEGTHCNSCRNLMCYGCECDDEGCCPVISEVNPYKEITRLQDAYNKGLMDGVLIGRYQGRRNKYYVPRWIYWTGVSLMLLDSVLLLLYSFGVVK